MNYFFSIFFGVIGGFVAYKIDIPLPWMLGPLFFIGFLCAIKVEIILPKKPLPSFRALLGCVIGTNFTEEIFININQIGKSLFLLPFFASPDSFFCLFSLKNICFSAVFCLKRAPCLESGPPMISIPPQVSSEVGPFLWHILVGVFKQDISAHHRVHDIHINPDLGK